MKDYKASENALILAIDAAGLGRFEYNDQTKEIEVNDRVRSWLGIDTLGLIPIKQFLKSIKNSADLHNLLTKAFANDLQGLSTDIAAEHCAPELLHITGQISADKTKMSGIIQVISAPIEHNPETFFQLTNTVPAIVWTTDINGYCTYLNQQWTEYTGISVQSSEGFGWLNAIPPDDREQAEVAFLDCTTKHIPYKVNFRVKSVAGDYRWCIDHGVPQFTENGNFIGMVGTVVDIHEEHLASEKSKYREEELNSIVESATFPIGVYIGTELRIKIANKSMIEAWGKGDDVIGKLYTDILPELENQEIFRELQHVVLTGTPIHHKNKKVELYINQKLTTHYFNYSFTPLMNSDGTVYGVMNTAVDVTDLNKAKSKSQQNEQRFIKLVDTAPVAIGVFSGRQLVIETYNTTFAQIVGKGDNISGKRLCEVMPELQSEGQPFLEILDQVFSTGIPYETFGTQVKIVQNGKMTYNYYNFTYTPMFDENGDVYAILDIAVDVTENVISQNMVRESEKSLRNTILKAPVAMCILKQPNFIVEIANDRMIDLWQVSPEILNKPLFDYLPEAKEQGFDKLLLKVVNNGETIKAYETAFSLSRNGEVQSVYVDFVYEPFRDNDEKIAGVIVVAHEVTQQVLARRKIEEAEARARLAIDAADLGVYEVNYNDPLDIKYSSRFMEIWGLSEVNDRAQLIEKIHPDDRKKRELAHLESYKTGNLDYEARIHKEDKSQSWIRVSGKVLMDDAGMPSTLIGVVQDITEQKQFAEELTRLVFQRTLELQRSNEDLQQFAHVASHDLKEPVRKIKFYSNMLQDQFGEMLPTKAVNHLDKIHNATDRMFSMIDGVLKYSLIRGTAQDIENIDLNEVFQNVQSDLEVLIAQKKGTILVGDLPHIEGAAVLIHQLFYNIVNNALKFSATEVQPIISVESEILKRYDVEMAKIIISDNGIGLDPDYISKIFNPFIRLNPRDKYEGTGLGLSLCKKIVEQHYGTIEATGKPGQGAVFKIILPLKQDGKLYVPAT